MIAHRIALAVFLCARAGLCQNAQLSGMIQDPSALAVVGAQISVRNEQTGGRRVTQSNESGLYSVSSLSPGLYRLAIHVPGFETIVREGVRLEVGDNARLDFTLRLGDSRTVVTVTDGPLLMNTEDASVGMVIDRNIIDRMPLNGRGIQALLELTPGLAMVPTWPKSRGQFVVNGQRGSANYFTVDGVSANFAAGLLSNVGRDVPSSDGQLGAGNLPALSQLGTFSNLVSPEALQEFRIQTSTFAPEFGRTPGAQVSLVTRSGTNRYAGTLFEYLRNEVTDANDWFNNFHGVAKPAVRFHDFGLSWGGPVQIPHIYQGYDRTFFFVSVENTLLKQPRSAQVTYVPAANVRREAPASLAPLLNAFPFPNRLIPAAEITFPGWDLFAGTPWVSTAQQTYSVRLDHYFSDKMTAFVRYNQSPSRVSDRPYANPAVAQRYVVDTQMLTLGLTQTAGPNLVNELRLNGSRQIIKVSATPDGYGGSQPIPDAWFPPGYSLNNSSVTILGGYPMYASFGLNSNTRARQLQVVESLTYVHGAHRLKFGADYRWYSPVDDSAQYSLAYLFLNKIIGGNGEYNELASSMASSRRLAEIAYAIPTFSAYAQDTWRLNKKWTATYGFRWEVNPAPRVISGDVSPFARLTSLQDLSQISLLPPEQPIYPTDYGRIAPRAGVAWQIFDGQAWKTVLRAGAGIYYDPPQNGFTTRARETASVRISSQVPLLSVPDVFDTYDSGILSPFLVAAAPHYTLPRTYQWNVTVEQLLGQQAFSVAYVGAVGRHLTGYAYYRSKSASSLNIMGSEFSSDYHSLQLQFNRRLARRLQALVSYTWSHSIDNKSYEAVDLGVTALLHPDINRGPSDFDLRHTLNGTVLMDLPSLRRGKMRALFQNWSISSFFFARSAAPTDVAASQSLDTGVSIRPDLVFGQPLYLYGSGYPGGRRLNPAAFSSPEAGIYQGTLGRNALRGFPAWQIDLAVQRRFPLSERSGLQLRAEAFNVLNHPNFASPIYGSTGPQLEFLRLNPIYFGYSRTSLGQLLSPPGPLGQLNPVFQIGQSRAIQFSLRLTF